MLGLIKNCHNLTRYLLFNEYGINNNSNNNNNNVEHQNFVQFKKVLSVCVIYKNKFHTILFFKNMNGDNKTLS